MRWNTTECGYRGIKSILSLPDSSGPAADLSAILADCVHNQLQPDINSFSQQDEDVTEASPDYGQGKDNQQSDQADQHGVFCQFLT